MVVNNRKLNINNTYDIASRANKEGGEKVKKMILAVLLAVLFLGGCASIREVYYIDPSIRKVVLFNDSPYLIEERGIFNGQVEPGGRLETNVSCYKTLKGLATAYKRVGKNKAGEKVYEIFGQKWYTVNIDGKNTIINGVDTDGYKKFSAGSFSPSQLKKGRAYYMPISSPCSADPKIKVR